MAYDLIVGRTQFVKDNPTIIGAIDMNEYPELCSLLKRKDSFFLARLTDLFQDQSFSIQELTQAQLHLLGLLPIELTRKERILLHKLIAVIAYALQVQEPLYGVAD